jgi:hypothetical protein
MIIDIHEYSRCIYEYPHLFMKFEDFMNTSRVLWIFFLESDFSGRNSVLYTIYHRQSKLKQSLAYINKSPFSVLEYYRHYNQKPISAFRVWSLYL